MPGLIRKLVVSTNDDGIILRAHGAESYQSIIINYGTRSISVRPREEHVPHEHRTHLEVYGVIGLINIASLSFLIAITKREQVAQVYGKPVYVVTDVAIIPLASQLEADEAITAAFQSRHKDQHLSDSDLSDSEDDDRSDIATDLPDSDGEDKGPYTHQNQSNSSIAEDVAKRRASYGKFASRWFFKQVWGATTASSLTGSPSTPRIVQSETKPTEERNDDAPTELEEINEESKDEIADKVAVDEASGPMSSVSAMSLLPKILRSTKMILSSRSFYFAYEFDLTRRFSLQGKRSQVVSRDLLDPLYFWNRRMGSAFIEVNQDQFLMPIIQGFVGQRDFSIATKSESRSRENDLNSDNTVSTVQAGSLQTEKARHYLLTLISRRSVKRSGLRYLRRGIDDKGNCANTVESEQILSSATWDKSLPIRSFVQIRGSIPLYFSQTPYSFKPLPMMHNSPTANKTAFRQHFQNLTKEYGAVQAAVLVNKHGTEASIGDAYEAMFKELHAGGQLRDVQFDWFDFHAECRGMKFENVQRLVEKLQKEITDWGETIIANDSVQRTQSGIIRTNCMDCLDRTNVAQSAFGQHILQKDLNDDGYTIDLVHDESTNWFNTLWADNGDAISRQYASTAALKGDFTRTRKRNWRGQMNDLGLTLSRYYSNMVNDYFSQAVIDVLLGNTSWKVFEDFETSMMSVDPGISVQSGREAAIENCTQIVIQNTDEDLIHGWTMLSPAQENTLRTLPFEEVVVLLTNAAIYCCKFDWNIEKVSSFEKVDLRSVSKIRIGTYITSTFTERQLDEQLNQGLVIVFTPGKGNVIRVNTRSLSNAVSLESRDRSSGDTGAGILSWFAPKTSSPIASHILALKVITRSGSVPGQEEENKQQSESPGNMAAHIGEEIKRAVLGIDPAQEHRDLIEVGDVISVVEARRRTGYLEQLGHSLKKMVWA